MGKKEENKKPGAHKRDISPLGYFDRVIVRSKPQEVAVALLLVWLS